MNTVFSRRLGSLAVGMGALLLAPRVAHAQVPCSYEVSAIIQVPECPPFGFPPTIGTGISEPVDGGLPNIVGYYQSCVIGPHRAFLWRGADGQFITLDTPPGTGWSRAHDISADGGQIVGEFDIPGDGLSTLGFILQDGNWTTIFPTGEALVASAAATNELRQVVGYQDHDEGMGYQRYGFLWEQGAFTDILPTQRGVSFALGLNQAAEVVGYMNWAPDWNNHAFLWADGKTIDLGVVPEGFTSEGFAVGAKAVVVGSGTIPMKGAPIGAPRAFLWEKGEFTMLGTLPNHTWSRAQDIRTEPRQVVGRSWNVDGNPNIAHGFIWQNGVMTDLNSLISPDAGLLIISAGGINSTGQIITAGRLNGSVVAALLTPIEVPIGDLDTDCAVGISDLLILLSNWGPCPPKASCPADLDADASVGILDLLTLLANWSSP